MNANVVLLIVTGNVMSRYAEGTSHFVMLLDQLFDTFNGRTVKPEKGKPFRCALSKTSPHLKFWNDSLPVMSSVRFLKKNDEEYVPPSIKNWIQTIKGILAKSLQCFASFTAQAFILAGVGCTLPRGSLHLIACTAHSYLLLVNMSYGANSHILWWSTTRRLLR